MGVMLRLTRLVVLDTITEPIRKHLSGWVGKLITCGWCASIWLSFPVAMSWWVWSHHAWWQVGAIALTGSWLAGATLFAGMPQRHEVDVTPVAPLVVFSPPGAQSDQED